MWLCSVCVSNVLMSDHWKFRVAVTTLTRDLISNTWKKIKETLSKALRYQIYVFLLAPKSTCRRSYVTTKTVSIKRLAAETGFWPPHLSWFKDFVCPQLYPREMGWFSVAFRNRPPPHTFSSPLLTDVHQNLAASVCHCLLPRPGRAVLEPALQRTLKDVLRAPEEIPQSDMQHNTAFPLGHSTVGPIVCVIIQNLWILFTVQRNSWEIFYYKRKGVGGSFLNPGGFYRWSRMTAIFNAAAIWT